MIQHTPPAATYCYENLGERHIRLLKLLVSSNADPTYNLIETSLDSAPPYETVSYVWGREQDRSQALTFASSQTVHVTPTLQHTLSHLYSRCQTGYLWLDQICIDQSNILECNQQVGLMGEVYSKAQRVLIWLGEGDEDSQHLSTLLDITSTSIQQQHSFNQFSRKSHSLLRDSTDTANESRRLSIRKLLALPWFGRAWVVQEAVLPNTATYFLGPLGFDIDTLWLLVRKLRNVEDQRRLDNSSPHSIRQLPGYLVLSEIMRLRQQRQDEQELKNSKACFYHSLSLLAPRCQTSKPQDMIFAFLGLVNDPRIRISPDYHMPLNEISATVTRAIVNGTGSLDLFGVLHRQGENEGQRSQLPSWVPDWSERLKAEALVFPGSPTYFNASAGFPHRHDATSGKQFAWSDMTVYGKVIDEVALRIDFTQGIAAPASSRQKWDVHSYLDIPRIHKHLTQLWPPGLSPPTRERLVVAMLADGSFAFNDTERSRCRDGLSQSHIQELLITYESLNRNSPNTAVEGKVRTTAFRDHARIAWGRALIIGRNWRLGLACETVCEGDFIYVVHGSKVPLVLRRLEDGRHRLMGQCYFEDVMRGEAVMWDEKDADVFVLT